LQVQQPLLTLDNYKHSANTPSMTDQMLLSLTNCWRWESVSTPEMWTGISAAYLLHKSEVRQQFHFEPSGETEIAVRPSMMPRLKGSKDVIA